jgi:hypothetical protein
MPIVSNPMLQAWSVDLARRYALTLCTCQNNATTPARQISCCAATSPRLEEHSILDSTEIQQAGPVVVRPGLPAPSIGSRAALTRHACSQGSGEWLPSTLAHTAHRAQFHLEFPDPFVNSPGGHNSRKAVLENAARHRWTWLMNTPARVPEPSPAQPWLAASSCTTNEYLDG